MQGYQWETGGWIEDVGREWRMVGERTSRKWAVLETSKSCPKNAAGIIIENFTSFIEILRLIVGELYFYILTDKI